MNKFLARFLFPFAVFCLFFGASVHSVFADGPSVVLITGSDVGGPSGQMIPITDLQVDGPVTSTVPVHLYVATGTLSMVSTTGITFFNDVATGTSIFFSGLLPDVNTALASLRYVGNTVGTSTLEASVVPSGVIYYPGNNHLYEVVDNGSSISANDAKTAADARVLGGVPGYLATITSAEENDFVSSRLTSDGWLGASDVATEGDWKWIDGPETGTSFWNAETGSVEGRYANWHSGEPNNAGGNENCAEFYAGVGAQWNDLPCGDEGDGLSSYVTEYGSDEALPSISTSTLTITVSPPVFSGLGAGTVEDPYQITDCDQLQEMDQFLDGHFILENDIDCSATNPENDLNATSQWADGKGFNPIGTVALMGRWIWTGFIFQGFSGSLDGNHHKISHVYINRGTDSNDVEGYYVGLFSTITSGASVHDLEVEDVNVTASGNETGGLAGGLSGTVTNVTTTGMVHGNNNVGGMVGVHVDSDHFPNSSPLVYTWNGEKYVYTDDVGGILPKTLSGVDLAQIDSKDIAPKDGKYSMKITEEYNEVVYYDELALMTFDHQPGYSVVEPLNRSAGVRDLRTVRDVPTHPLLSCTDNRGHNCLDALQAYDDKWSYENAGNSFNKENLKKSWILDFGDLSGAADINLVIRGARDYAASAQYPGNTVRSIQVKNARGEWVEVYNKNQIGSDGSPRLRTISLTGKFLTHDYHVKVAFDTFNANYFAVDTSPQVPFTAHTYHPDRVNLDYHGFTEIDRTHYFKHDYDKVSPAPDSIFKNQYGNFTKYGEVTPLLQSPDDHFVVMRYGDQLSAEFPYVAPAPGMVRSFILYNDVLYKHATNDNLGVLGQSAGYLPYHGMTKYSLDMAPYPMTPANVDYINTWNTRNYPGPFPDALRRGSSTIIDSYASTTLIGGSQVGGIVGNNQKEIRNSHSAGTVVCLSSTCGGIAGYNESTGSIHESYSEASISSDGGYGAIGGVVGINFGAVTSTYATGNVTNLNLPTWGGTIGGFVGGNYGDIIDVYSTGDVRVFGSGNRNQIGGFAGYTQHIIANAYSTGDVTGGDYVGGFVGLDDSGGECLCAITNSFSTGDVTADEGATNVGGFIGRGNGADYPVLNDYWFDNQANGVGTGYDDQPTKVWSATYFKGPSIPSRAPFVENWDFTSTPIWHTQSLSYPVFRGSAPAGVASVITAETTSSTQTTITVHGTVTEMPEEGTVYSYYGVVYGSHGSELGDESSVATHASEGAITVGDFTVSLGGLSCGATYDYKVFLSTEGPRLYALNTETFTMPECEELTALIPHFGTPTSTEDGFTVQITNYDPAFSWSGTASHGEFTWLDESGLAQVSGLETGATSTLTVTTTRLTYPEGVAHVTGHALSYSIVNSLLDDGNGNCTAVKCTLRDAIANSLGGDTITFSVTGTIMLTQGDPMPIAHDLTITGPGASVLTIDFGSENDVNYINQISGILHLSGVTITHGDYPVWSSAGEETYISGVVFKENNQFYPSLYLDSGDAFVTNTTFASNTGAIYAGGHALQVVNVTFSANSTTQAAGAIENNNGHLTVVNSTFSGNRGSSAGAIYQRGASSTATIINSILTGGSPDECAGRPVTSLGHNIDAGTSCSFEATGDLSNTDPRLEALTSNGGHVLTMALLAGSPALNAGDDESAPETDARGYARVGRSDIGAYEYAGTYNDGDGVTSAVEDAAPNRGDADGDGVKDAEQPNVTSLPNAQVGEGAYVTLRVDNTRCSTLTSVSVGGASGDAHYIYPVGLLDFGATCSSGTSTTVTVYYDREYDTSRWVARKYIHGSYTDVDGAVFGTALVGSTRVTTLTYTLTDGGLLDADGVVNGTIIDPVGPGVPVTPVVSGGGGGGGGGGGSATSFIAVYGCMDAHALNFNPRATHQSFLGECQYAVTPNLALPTTPTTNSGAPLATSSTMPATPVVKTAETQLPCSLKLDVKKSVRLGAKNDPAMVRLLERYLNTYEGTNLPVDGIYSTADRDAVVKWQEKYAAEILKPWGIKKGTGYVFTTSLKKMEQIHEKACSLPKTPIKPAPKGASPKKQTMVKKK